MLCVFIIGKAVYVQRVEGTVWKNMSDSLHQKIQELDADRGTIYSEDGQMLSTSIPQFDIYLDFMADGLRAKNGKIFNKYKDSFAISLANYFKDKSAEDYLADLEKGYAKKSRYYPLKKKISFQDYKNFRQFPLVSLGRNRSGVIVEQSSKRLLPFGLLANRTIGLSREYLASNGKVKKQNVGLEMSFDSILSGENGHRLVRYTKAGPISVDGYQIDPQNGKDVYTTLDVHIQDIAQNALYKMMDSSKSLFATCIVMETATGKIKAIANLGLTPDGSIREDDNYALRVTEPGSTIKLATMLAAIDKGTFKGSDKVYVGGRGSLQVGPRVVVDAERSPWAEMTVLDCFAHSSNVGMGKIGYESFGDNPKEYKEYLHRFHLDAKSPIELAHLPTPRVAPLDKNKGGAMNLVTMSFGYAIQVSPLHILTLYNAVANNGKMMKPYLVNAIRKDGIIIDQKEPTVLENNVASAEAIEAAQVAMARVVTEGTARRAFAGNAFAVAGKTGTAHVADGEIKYRDRIYQASFVGYFPANKPQYSCIVTFRTSKNSYMHYGGQVAAPVFREIATKMYANFVDSKSPTSLDAIRDSVQRFQYAGNAHRMVSVYKELHLPTAPYKTAFDWFHVSAANQQAQTEEVTIVKNRIPNVRGMGLRDALQLLEKMGLQVKVKGRGKVSYQSVAPGTAARKGQEIEIELI